MMRSVSTILIGLFGLVFLSACQSGPQSPYHSTLGDNRVVVYLVRHAEKQTGNDPELTADGEARAARLAEYLSGEPVVAIWSTDFARTRATAAPVAEMHGLEVELYEPGHIYRMADRTRGKEGVVLIVGHSNTIPKIAAEFRGEGDDADFADDDYESLYWVEINKDGETLVFEADYASLKQRVTQ